MLINFISKFAEYNKDDPLSFNLPKELLLYPQFMFHLRRSQFLKVSNVSPDETEFYKNILFRENVANSILMIRPILLQYTIGTINPTSVLPDASYMKDDVILLFDNYFSLIVWYGETIIQWKENGYHKIEEYEWFKEMLKAPEEDAKILSHSRFPHPKCYKKQNTNSYDIKIKWKLNKVTELESIVDDNTGSIFEEDTNLEMFISHLIKLVVQ